MKDRCGQVWESRSGFTFAVFNWPVEHANKVCHPSLVLSMPGIPEIEGAVRDVCEEGYTWEDNDDLLRLA